MCMKVYFTEHDTIHHHLSKFDNYLKIKDLG